MARGHRPLLLSPSRWPVRWRLAGVSAGLTFAILLVFAAGVGRLAQNRLESDFRSEVDGNASQLVSAIDVNPVTNELTVHPLEFERMVSATDAVVRVIQGGQVEFARPDSATLPPPRVGTVDFGELVVATRVIPSNSTQAPPVYVQYAQDHDKLDATIGRLWLFLGVGVLAGGALATLAGLWIARRAMQPIAGLTATAREIATTRDPSLAMPEPQADDEVAELARTLDSMLRELDAARTESQQLVQAQREFVADASHELRTPLTSILANLELLAERLDTERPGSDEGEMVESALRSSRRMRRLVGDLLMLARADAGRFGERQPCDLAEIAEAAAAEVRPVAGDHTLELSADGPVAITCNGDELHRLTVNLLDNAVRHTPPGSTVELTVERRDGNAVLEVTDDGPGLPAGMEEQVFSRFVRGGGPADLAADAGTGLGLAIVQAVAQSHGGDVAAGESPAGGARFTVTLPAADPTPTAPKELSAKV